MMTRRRITPGALAATVLVGIAMLARSPLEARMTSHMFVQLPMLLVAGVLLVRPRLGGAVATDLLAAVAGLVLASGIVTTWMIPRALDLAVEHTLVDAAKAGSLLLAGAAGAWAWHRAPAMVRVFALGNMAWMTATTGLLYLDAPVRVCTSYGRDDQRQTGIALVAFTVLAGAVGLWRVPERSVPSERTPSLLTGPNG
jgi:hypothetical protein